MMTERPININHVELLIGGNQGNRFQLIEEACQLIGSRIGHIALMSKIYETAPWGFEAEQDFLNAALMVETDQQPEKVLDTALAIEATLGRTRSGKGYASRPMDIDIIFYNDAIINTPRLTIPHPRMHLRRFVLTPLADILPDYVHPLLQKSILELLTCCPDTSEVRPFASQLHINDTQIHTS